MGWFGDALEDIWGANVEAHKGAAQGVFEVADTVTFGFFSGIGDVASDIPSALQWGSEQAGEVMGMNEVAQAQESIYKQQQKAGEEYTKQEIGRVQQRTDTALTQASDKNKVGSSGTF